MNFVNGEQVCLHKQHYVEVVVNLWGYIIRGKFKRKLVLNIMQVSIRIPSTFVGAIT